MGINEPQWGWSESPMDYLNFAFELEKDGKADVASGVRQFAEQFSDWLDVTDARWSRRFDRRAPLHVDEAHQAADELGVVARFDAMSRNWTVEILERLLAAQLADEQLRLDRQNKKWPRNPEVVAFAHFVHIHGSRGETLTDLARQFSPNNSKADNLRRQLQRHEYAHLLEGSHIDRDQ